MINPKEISYQTLGTPMGVLLVGATAKGVCFVSVGSSEAQLAAELRKEFKAVKISKARKDEMPKFKTWLLKLAAYLEGKNVKFSSLPLDNSGSEFQNAVWKYLRSIPRGEVRTYSEVARGVGKPKAIRAAASACGANNVCLIIPCHRVIRSDGALGGFRWGLDRKKKLLDFEAD